LPERGEERFRGHVLREIRAEPGVDVAQYLVRVPVEDRREV
jgi:hypothetical protein